KDLKAARRGFGRDVLGKHVDLRAGSAPARSRMGILEFQVCRQGREARWVVRLGNAVYGSYLDKEQALLDAVDAARDALQCGREAQVWVRERANAARIL